MLIFGLKLIYNVLVSRQTLSEVVPGNFVPAIINLTVTLHNLRAIIEKTFFIHRLRNDLTVISTKYAKLFDLPKNGFATPFPPHPKIQNSATNSSSPSFPYVAIFKHLTRPAAHKPKSKIRYIYINSSICVPIFSPLAIKPLLPRLLHPLLFFFWKFQTQPGIETNKTNQSKS